VAIAAIAVMTMSVAAGAQEKGDMAAGGNLVFGSGSIASLHFLSRITGNVRPSRLFCRIPQHLTKNVHKTFLFRIC
jgi:hypothetical protein